MVFFFQQFGVIPFDIRTLKKHHTEKWRARRIAYKKAGLCDKSVLILASFSLM